MKRLTAIFAQGLIAMLPLAVTVLLLYWLASAAEQTLGAGMSLSNRFEDGASAQATLMSVFRTLRLRGHDPIQSTAQALHAYVQTGKLPPLPAPKTGTAAAGG